MTTIHGRNIRRGEIYYIYKGTNTGCEIEAGRPALVVSNDTFNETSNVIEVVYLTTRDKKDFDTHVVINATGVESTILCEQISTVAVERFGSYKTTLTPEEMKAVESALLYSLGISQSCLPKDNSIDEQGDNEENTADNTTDLHDNPEYVKLNQQLYATTIEKDFYKKLYDELLNKVIK